MVKESRLSFRIPQIISDKVDVAILLHTEFPDRSEFGTQAVKFFLQYLMVTKPEVDIFSSALIKIAKRAEITTKELR